MAINESTADLIDANKTRVANIRDLPDGWQVFKSCVYIGRANPRLGLSGSKWANPYKIGRDGTREEVIAKYRQYVLGRPDLLASLDELRGRELACWCAPEMCHGDVLIELLESRR